jgi:geranylgeranyl reductase family protein
MSNHAVNTYDVIVIGAGPSGSAAGVALARDGFSVVVVDRAEFPRDKPCGGLLSAKCMSLLGKVLDGSAIEHSVRARSHGCRLFYKESLVTEVKDSIPITLVARRELDLQMRTAAELAGCEVRERSRVVEVGIRNGTVTLSSGVEIRGRFIVAADGARSIVARSRGKKGRSPTKGMGIGLVTEIPIEQVRDGHDRDKLVNAPSIFFGIVPWGYGWIFPHGNVLNVGVGGLFLNP